MRDPKERLRDILDAIDAIDRYSVRGRPAFDGDELVQAWIVRNLQIIGEAARSLSPDVRDRYTSIPWTKVIGMRHILVHDYFAVDTEIVWDVVVRFLPDLRRNVKMMLRDLDETES